MRFEIHKEQMMKYPRRGLVLTTGAPQLVRTIYRVVREDGAVMASTDDQHEAEAILAEYQDRMGTMSMDELMAEYARND